MSLENEIKELNETLKLLISTIADLPVIEKPKTEKPKTEEPKTEKPKAKTEKPKAEKEETPPQEITYDDVKNKILQINRADRANKDKLKALLQEYDAVKVADIHQDKLVEVHGRLMKGEY